MPFRIRKESTPSGESRGSTELPQGPSRVRHARLSVPVEVTDDTIAVDIKGSKGNLSAGEHFRPGYGQDGQFVRFDQLQEEGYRRLTLGSERTESVFEIRGARVDVVVYHSDESDPPPR